MWLRKDSRLDGLFLIEEVGTELPYRWRISQLILKYASSLLYSSRTSSPSNRLRACFCSPWLSFLIWVFFPRAYAANPISHHIHHVPRGPISILIFQLWLNLTFFSVGLILSAVPFPEIPQHFFDWWPLSLFGAFSNGLTLILCFFCHFLGI